MTRMSVISGAQVGSIMRKMWRRKTVLSHWGQPVPQVAKAVSFNDLAKLVEVATIRGYSRVASGLEPQAGWNYFLVPYLPEPSPEPAWICLVVGVENIPAPEGVVGQEIRFARLDVDVSVFEGLGDASVWQRDQLVHWLAWRAARKPEVRPPSE